MPRSKRDTTPTGARNILWRVLADGEWHSFQQVYYALEGTIPPQKAAAEADTTKMDFVDLEQKVRYGKETIVSKAISDMRCEWRGPKYDRRSKECRFVPERLAEVGEFHAIAEGAKVAFRALMANDAMRLAFGALTRVSSLNPAQRYWVNLALQPEEPLLPQAEEES